MMRKSFEKELYRKCHIDFPLELTRTWKKKREKEKNKKIKNLEYKLAYIN